MFKVLVNYNHQPDAQLLDNALIFDRSDDGVQYDFGSAEVKKTRNIGNVDYDKLGYLIDNYDTLPDIFLWGKTNLFKYIEPEAYDKVKDNTDFTPLLSQNHRIYRDSLGIVNFYDTGMYYERNGLWTGEWPEEFVGGRFQTVNDLARYLCLPQLPLYLPFAPGGNYMLTRERVHRYSRDLYEAMRKTLEYAMLPPEAHWCERLYFILWR